MQDYHSSVYVWGSTAHGVGCRLDGEAAVGSKKVQLVPRRFTPSTTSVSINGGSAIQVVASNGLSTILTDKWEAYSWGSCVDGKNGRGRNRGVLAKEESGAMSKVQAENVSSISHGTGHTCAVTLKGEVYGWGSNLGVGNRQSNSRNESGRQRFLAGSSGGNDARRTFVANPRKMVFGDTSSSKSIAVACGEKHTCILQQDGTLLTMGANDLGQLGIGPSSQQDRHKEKSTKGFHVIQSIRRGPIFFKCVPFKAVSCGNNHCAAISAAQDNGMVYTWGWGMNGRLGHGNEKLCNHPTYVDALSDFAPFGTVACGSSHTLLATEDGDVYGFGWNLHLQVIGRNKDNEDRTSSSDDCLLPVPCLMKKGVVKLSCSGFHSAAITLSGSLYCWGKLLEANSLVFLSGFNN